MKKAVVADLFGNKLRSFTYNYPKKQQCNTNANQNEHHFDHHYADRAETAHACAKTRNFEPP